MVIAGTGSATVDSAGPTRQRRDGDIGAAERKAGEAVGQEIAEIPAGAGAHEPKSFRCIEPLPLTSTA